MSARMLKLALGGVLLSYAPKAKCEDAAHAGTQKPGVPLADKNDKGIESINVTATRRSQSVQKVPISIVALSQKQLTERQIKTIADIASVTPGLTFQLNGYASTLTIITFRGLESLFGASTVGVYVDDTPIQGRLSADGNVGNPYPSVFDLKRVEVERGPQGTLFGAGSETGTVRFISNEPSLTNYSGVVHSELEGTQGGDPSGELGAALGGPIVQDKIGFRISAWERYDGGYIDRVTPWNDETVARNTNWDRTASFKAAMAFQLGEDTRVTPSVFYQNIYDADASRFNLNFSDPNSGSFKAVTLLPERTTDHFVLPSIKLESHLPFADLTAIASYLNRRADLTSDLSGFVGALGLVDYGNPLGVSYAERPGDLSPLRTGVSTFAYTQEVRLASNNPDGFVTWVAGVYHDHRSQQDYQHETSLDVDPTGKEIFDTLQTVADDQTAIFGQADIHLSKQWTVVIGDRLAWTNVDQHNVNGTGVLDATPQLAHTQLSEMPNTPHVSLNYQLDSRNLLYFSYSEGFRVGGGNDPLPPICGYSSVPSTYTSDHITNYEVGAKNNLLNGRLQLDTSAFHIVWDKIQQLAQPACGISYTFNAGSAVSDGFDMAINAAVTENFRVDLSVAYANAHLTQDVHDARGVILAESGDRIGYLPFVAPPWNVSAAAQYVFPLEGEQEVRMRIEYKYNSSNPGPFINQITDSPNYAPQERPDLETNLFNARITYTRGPLDVSLLGNNLFDSHPLLGVYGQAVRSAVTYSTFRPRTFGLALNYAF